MVMHSVAGNVKLDARIFPVPTSLDAAPRTPPSNDPTTPTPTLSRWKPRRRGPRPLAATSSTTWAAATAASSAGAPEDAAHYSQDKHWIYLWTLPLKLAPLPAEPRDELLQATTPYEGFLAYGDLDERLKSGRGTAADIRAVVTECKRYEVPGYDCAAEAARYQTQPASKP